MALVLIALIIYLLWDVNYIARCIFTIFAALSLQGQRKVTDRTVIYGLFTAQDMDMIMRYTNNARYLRELDFGCFHFYVLTGLLRRVKEEGGTIIQSASNVCYRRTIPIFQPYKIVTRLIWWDDMAFYLEQKFISMNDDEVCAIAHSKQYVTNCNVIELMEDYEFPRPDIPVALQLWLGSLNLALQRLAIATV